MDNTTYIGIFCVRDQSAHLAMPVQNNSGLWQAWELPDGDLLIRPINENGIPWGSASLMARRTFIDFLTPYRLVGDDVDGPAPPVRPPSLSSHSPDLLTLWYKQAGPQASPAERLPFEMPGRAAASGSALSSDEANFAPVWEPDDAFFLDGLADDELEPPYAAANRGEQPSFAETFSSFINVLDADPPGAPPPLPPLGETPAGGTIVPPDPLQPDDPAELERIAFQAEVDMRKSFNELFERLDVDPAADRRLSLLLLSDAPFIWKQKYMFSEFGLSLRRKQRHEMALTCHLRALRFAPEDEHILFNVARTEYELGNVERAVDYLDRALTHAPDFSVARGFQDFLRGSMKTG